MHWLNNEFWDAASAVGSLLAVVAAIALADRSRRDAIERDVATIYALIVLAGGLRDIYNGRAARGPNADPTDPSMLNAFSEISRLVEAVTITSLPTRETADAFMVIATRLQMIGGVARLADLGVAPHSTVVDQCADATRTMTEQIKRLEAQIFLLRHPIRVRIVRGMARCLKR